MAEEEDKNYAPRGNPPSQSFAFSTETAHSPFSGLDSSLSPPSEQPEPYSKDAEYGRSSSSQMLSEEPEKGPPQESPSGPSTSGPSSSEDVPTRLSTDKPTDKDALGFRTYARAIAQFLTDDESKPPLTISIQAPWGGGKTSMMLMIEEELDPKTERPGHQEGVLAVRKATPMQICGLRYTYITELKTLRRRTCMVS